MKKKDKKYTHVLVKDGHGIDYLCPAKKTDRENRGEEIDFNVCFENNVPGRYAARVRIKKP